MQIKLYTTFQKRENSTKQPPVDMIPTTLNGYLRQPCSLLNPVFQIERLPSDACPDQYTYAKIEFFITRYYFVTDWIWADSLWECHLKEDVLATWRSNIHATYAYIERSAYESNGAIQDKLYPATTMMEADRVGLNTAWENVAPSGGCFVLGIISKASTYSATMSGGAVTYYVMSPAQMKSLLNYLLSDGFLDDAGFPTQMTTLQQLAHDTAKAMINPIQYISSCTWFPFSQSSLSDGVNRAIQLGYYDIGSNVAQGQYLTSIQLETYVTGTIPDHPQAALRGTFLNYPPYTKLSMTIHPFGMFPVDPFGYNLGKYLKCPVVVDTITGKATLRVEVYEQSDYSGSRAILYETSAMLGVPIQLAQMSPDYLGALQSAIQVGASVGSAVATGIPSSADLSLVLNLPTIGNAINHLMPQVQTQGVNGSFAECSPALPPILTAEHYIIADEDNTECGRPLCEVRIIGTQDGYVKCGEATVDYPCMLEEKQQILHYLHAGFFVE